MHTPIYTFLIIASARDMKFCYIGVQAQQWEKICIAEVLNEH